MKKKILIIDDDNGFHNRLKNAYPSKYQFYSVHNAFDALRVIQYQTDISLIILDVNLNKELQTYDGLVLILEIKEKINCPIIVVTGLPSFSKTNSFDKVAIKLGADGFLRKQYFDIDIWENTFDLAIGFPYQDEIPLKQIKKILFFASNPKDTNTILINREAKEIDNIIQNNSSSIPLQLIPKLAVEITDIRKHLLVNKPDILHFSGHGTQYGYLTFHDENNEMIEVKPEYFANLFLGLDKTIECIVLNACYSEKQAQILSKYAKYIVGTSAAIKDKDGALPFSAGFYEDIAFNKSIPSAFFNGCNRVALQSGKKEALKPVLFVDGEKYNFDEVKSLLDS